MSMFTKVSAALAIGASIAALGATGADAQRRSRGQAAATPAAPANPPVSREFVAAYQPVNTAITAQNWTAADAALPALIAAAKTPYETYAARQMDLKIATGLANVARQRTAIDAMIESGGVPVVDQARLYTASARMAYGANDYARAAERSGRAIELGDTNPEVGLVRIDALSRSGQLDAAIAAGQGLIASAKAGGGQAPDTIYGLTARAAQQARRDGPLAAILMERVQLYPTSANFRSASLAYLKVVPDDRQTSLDVMRLLKATGGMDDRLLFLEYAQSAAEDGLPNEAMTAIRAGRAANLVPAGDRAFGELESLQQPKLAEDRSSLGGSERRAIAAPDARLAVNVANAYLSYNDYARAEAVYTAALGKTGVDAALVNTRIGITRYGAGNYPGALQAFGLVQQGPRAPIARLWEAAVRMRQAPATTAAPAVTPTPAAPPARTN